MAAKEDNKKNQEKEKTVTIANADLNSIVLGLNEIGSLDIEDFPTNLAISTNISRLKDAQKAYGKSTQALAKKYVTKLPNGNLSITDNFYDFDTPELKQTYLDELDKLNEASIEARVFTLKTSKLKEIEGLKGKSMAMCFAVIEDDSAILS